MNDIEKLCLYKGKEVETKIEDVDYQSNKEFQSDFYNVIKSISQKVNGKYIYFYIVECKKCGSLKKIYRSDWKNQKLRMCKRCLSITKRESHIGYENKTYKVVGINFERSNQNKRRVYYDVVCKNCGAKLVLRWDAIYSDTKNTRCSKCCGNNIIPSENAVYNVLYNSYKQNAIMRNFGFELTRQEFNNLILQDCFYCGNPPHEVQSLKRYNKTGVPIFTNGIDRKNSNSGYTIENCVPCCEMCNRMKLNYDINTFYKHIYKIYHHKSLTTISQESTSQANGDGSGGSPEMENDIV